MGTRRTQWRTPSLTQRQVASLPATARFERILFNEVLISCLCRGWALEATSSPLRGHRLPGLVSPMSPGCIYINRWYLHTVQSGGPTATASTISTALSRREAPPPSAASALWRGRAPRTSRRRRETKQPGGLSGRGASVLPLGDISCASLF